MCLSDCAVLPLSAVFVCVVSVLKCMHGAATQLGALPLNYAHDPDFYKLLRAVRWYSTASCPSGEKQEGVVTTCAVVCCGVWCCLTPTAQTLFQAQELHRTATI